MEKHSARSWKIRLPVQLLMVGLVAGSAVLARIAFGSGSRGADALRHRIAEQREETRMEKEDNSSDLEAEYEEGRLGRFQRRINITQTAASSKRQTRAKRTLVDPPYLACFVELSEQGRELLEEWVMLDDEHSLATLRDMHFLHVSNPAALSCEPLTPADAVGMVCAQCISYSGAGPVFLGSSRDTGMTVVSRMTDLRSCMSSGLGATMFCKRGSLVAGD
eukprot:TRINITY_DN44732_c0_g1_i1.p1 TRINITY_DN44732_c0_g1~~TRINITY_DN44732_c0_g1_i1.p1  ORF type:complete len:233 (+),score=33.92 TRINITY_DN44732_c0_g1_i1:40-699(+)